MVLLQGLVQMTPQVLSQEVLQALPQVLALVTVLLLALHHNTSFHYKPDCSSKHIWSSLGRLCSHPVTHTKHFAHLGTHCLCYHCCHHEAVICLKHNQHSQIVFVENWHFKDIRTKFYPIGQTTKLTLIVAFAFMASFCSGVDDTIRILAALLDFEYEIVVIKKSCRIFCHCVMFKLYGALQ